MSPVSWMIKSLLKGRNQPEKEYPKCNKTTREEGITPLNYKFIDVNTITRKAEALLEAGKYREGVDLLSPHMHNKMNNAQLILIFGGLLANLSRHGDAKPEDAKAYLDRAMFMLPSKEDPLRKLATYYQIAGYNDEADRMFEEARKCNNVPMMRSTGEDLSRPSQMNNTAFDDGKEMMLQLMEARERAIREPDNAHALYELSKICMMTGEFNEGVTAALGAININACDPDFWQVLGHNFQGMDDDIYSLACHMMGLKMSTEMEYTWKNIGNAYLRLGEYSHAGGSLSRPSVGDDDAFGDRISNWIAQHGAQWIPPGEIEQMIRNGEPAISKARRYHLLRAIHHLEIAFREDFRLIECKNSVVLFIENIPLAVYFKDQFGMAYGKRHDRESPEFLRTLFCLPESMIDPSVSIPKVDIAERIDVLIEASNNAILPIKGKDSHVAVVDLGAVRDKQNAEITIMSFTDRTQNNESSVNSKPDTTMYIIH